MSTLVSYLDIVNGPSFDKETTLNILTQNLKKMDREFIESKTAWTRGHSTTYRQIQTKVNALTVEKNMDYKKKHSQATKKGMEEWLKFKNSWLVRLEQYPNEFKSYNDKISHISILWKIKKKVNKERMMEKE